MQLQLLPQLWQPTVASACNPDSANALDLSDVAVLGEIVGPPPHPLSSPTGSLEPCALAKKTAPGGQ